MHTIVLVAQEMVRPPGLRHYGHLELQLLFPHLTVCVIALFAHTVVWAEMCSWHCLLTVRADCGIHVLLVRITVDLALST